VPVTNVVKILQIVSGTFCLQNVITHRQTDATGYIISRVADDW